MQKGVGHGVAISGQGQGGEKGEKGASRVVNRVVKIAARLGGEGTDMVSQ